MKKKKLIALLASIGLVLVLVMTGCTPAAEPEVVEKIVEKTVTVEVEKEYKPLNPIGEDTAHELGPLAPRIDSLDGKTIVIAMGEGSPVIMPALYERIQKEFPTSTFIFKDSRTTRPPPMTDEELEVAEAVIIGNAW